MYPFSNISQFKKALKPGLKMGCRLIYYNQNPENKELLPVVEERPIREIGRVQSNCFTLKTLIKGEWVESYCNFPKATECIVRNNTLIIYEELVGRQLPVLEYWFEE